MILNGELEQALFVGKEVEQVRLGNGSNPSSSVFYGYETSAKIISSAQGKILVSWKSLSEDEAINFIKKEPFRDSRMNFFRSRFRILLAQSSGVYAADKQMDLLRAARLKGWVTKAFETLMKNKSYGVAVQETEEIFTFIIQSPLDALKPVFSLSLVSPYDLRYNTAPDWNALVFIQSSTDEFEANRRTLQDYLLRNGYPGDFKPPLAPDFMVLPLSLLCWQVDQISSGVRSLRDKLTDTDKDILYTTRLDIKYLERIRVTLFELRRLQDTLQQRHIFAKQLAATLSHAFEKLRRRHRSDPDEPEIEYSLFLKEAVETQQFNLESLENYIIDAPLRIEAQQATMDSQTSIMIARNSELAAEESRRDSASMKTIAVVAMVFLPGTFIAAIFSMSMFQWIPDGGSASESSTQAGSNHEKLLSDWFWVYWAITIPLTVFVVCFWVIWYRRSDRKFQERKQMAMEEETKVD